MPLQPLLGGFLHDVRRGPVHVERRKDTYLNHKNVRPPAKITSQTSENRKYKVGRFIRSTLPMDAI
jgi:hypothetical protein